MEMSNNPKKKLVFNLNDIRSSDPNTSGGKGSNLYRLLQNGYNVPSGFIVSADAFRLFADYNELWLTVNKQISLVREDNIQSIIKASDVIKQKIYASDIPVELYTQLDEILSKSTNKKFAIRSSGVFEDSLNNSWAGQFDSYLNIEIQDIAEYIKNCWASLFNVQAISYNTEMYKQHEKINFAVVVQNMVSAEKSGVAFSINPTINDSNEILIEAVSGLGDHLVSGKDISFSATVDKSKNTVLRKKNYADDKLDLLNLEELQLISQKVINLEKLYGLPIDCEWSFDVKDLYFLQARPITGIRERVFKGSSLPNIKDYELTFKVSGLSFLFTDMLADGFKYLDPLFTSNEYDEFSQYFTNEKMEFAAKYGMSLFGDPNSFKNYQIKFTNYYESNIQILNSLLNKNISKPSIRKFFERLSGLFTYYSKMDNQFTNLAFFYSEENEVIKGNLELLSQFKDFARVWINTSAIDENNVLSKFIDKISYALKIEKQELEYYKIPELIDSYDGFRIPFKEIENRRKSYTIYCLSEQKLYLTGDESVEFITSSEVNQRISSDKELKGLVANKTQDLVEGNVRIINVDYGNISQMNEDIDQMLKGEILVAEFTAPELILACKKAKAIVTDIGGLLSHAAIVSRELNIPCLVGTGNATKTLKTGDKIVINFITGAIDNI